MSRSADAAVGMMDTAYFVGRGELLEFFNNLLNLQLSKIEQTASGAIACQLTEYIYPKSIPMSRVNWEAKSDYEFVQNYKLLQAAFNKHRIQRHVDVDKLIRAKYQDNLEFCQWLKAFYDQHGVVRDAYDGIAVRARGKGGKKYNEKMAGGTKAPVARSNRGAGARVTPTTTATTKSKPAARPTGRPSPATARAAAPSKAPLRGTSENMSTPSAVSSKQLQAATAELEKKNADLEARVEELESGMLEIEKERDFYFGKLRNVELMLQVKQDKNFEGCDLEGVIGSIFKVLYATAEEDIAVGDDGEILEVQQSVLSAELSAALASENADDVNLSLADESADDMIGSPQPEALEY